MTASNTTIKHILKDAKRILSKSDVWIKGVEAINKRGEEVPAGNSEACSFCTEGAIKNATLDHKYINFHSLKLYVDVVKVMDEITKSKGFSNTADFNDNENTKHSDILHAFDEAILYLKD